MSLGVCGLHGRPQGQSQPLFPDGGARFVMTCAAADDAHATQRGSANTSYSITSGARGSAV